MTPLTSQSVRLFVENKTFFILDAADDDNPVWEGDFPSWLDDDGGGDVRSQPHLVVARSGQDWGFVMVTVRTWASEPSPADGVWDGVAEVAFVWLVGEPSLFGGPVNDNLFPLVLPPAFDGRFQFRVSSRNHLVEDRDDEEHVIDIWPAHKG